MLIVDDEPSITDAVATALRYEGFVTSEVASGREAIRAAEEFGPDLVILDIMLPDLDGLERRAEAARPAGPHAGDLPVRARRHGRQGGRPPARRDDYVAKPFSLAELVARIHAVLRRTRNEAAYVPAVFADLELDEDTYEVRRAGARIELTPTEFKLLRFLLRNPRRVLSKRQILDHVWQYDFGGDANIVETYVSYLRRKLDRHGPPLIHTVRLRRLRSAGDLMRPRSLRTRLVAITTLLAAIGLIVAGIATYAALRSFLLERVDRTLAASTRRRRPGAHPRRSGRPRSRRVRRPRPGGPADAGPLRRGARPERSQAVRPGADAARRSGPHAEAAGVDRRRGRRLHGQRRGRGRRLRLPRAGRGAAVRPRRRDPRRAARRDRGRRSTASR